MGQFDELQELTPELTCCRCERVCEPLELRECPGCRRKFCNYCGVRMGGGEYCSSPCARALFFGAMDGDEGSFEDE